MNIEPYLKPDVRRALDRLLSSYEVHTDEPGQITVRLASGAELPLSDLVQLNSRPNLPVLWMGGHS